MLHSHYDFNYILKRPIQHLPRLLREAFEKREEERARKMWLAKYQRMDKKSFIPFSEFYKKATSAEVSNKSTADILSEVEAIRKRANPQIG